MKWLCVIVVGWITSPKSTNLKSEECIIISGATQGSVWKWKKILISYSEKEVWSGDESEMEILRKTGKRCFIENNDEDCVPKDLCSSDLNMKRMEKSMLKTIVSWPTN